MKASHKALFLFGIASRLVAESPESCDPCPDPCCPPPDPCAKCAQIWPCRGPDWIITPNAGPCVANGFDANVTADFIYWTAREDHLAFAYEESIQQIGSGSTRNAKKNTKHPDWNFQPGFKVGVGYLYDHDGWDIYANYTWLRVRDTKKTLKIDSTNTTESIATIWPNTTTLSSLTQISGRWQLDFNVVDLDLGRNFFISRYLKLRPNFGLKGTWQNQKYEVVAYNTDYTSIDDHYLDYWGIGIRAGLDTSWQFNRCFSFVGNLAVTALWEHFQASEKETQAPLIVGNKEQLTSLWVENDFRTIKPVIELFIGLRWETWFCCDCYHFGIEAGWEEQWWSDQNQFFDSASESRLGDLSLHGLTLKARIDF